MRRHFKIMALLWLGVVAATHVAFAAAENIVVGQLRVQLLSESLVRLEIKGANGFEDRVTFHVANRDWPGAAFKASTNSATIEIRTTHYTVIVRRGAASLEDVRVDSSTGDALYRFDGKLENSKWLPSPWENPQSWWFADSPRIVPPEWGLPSAPAKGGGNSGWDLDNDAADVYVFLPRGDYRRLRVDFLKLTGPTEMPPLFMLGAFDSRSFDCNEEAALKHIASYRSRKIPLDVLIVDTGWAAKAAAGYALDTNVFPDIARFISRAHEQNVNIVFKYHPQPLITNEPALDARESEFRYTGLSDLLNHGLDVWWYDGNTRVAHVPPAPNLSKEVWGMRLYRDMTARARPERRPIIMANADGMDDGLRNRPPNVAAHRFAFQRTGDTNPGFDFLQRGVENAVHAGVAAAFPYMSEDLGGYRSNPSSEGYIRWIEYGALSPVYRPSGANELKRMPWSFGAEAEAIARKYIHLRYRLLPLLYAACRENFESGEPLLRRLDLDHPQFEEARRDDQYLLGNQILVAPIISENIQVIPASWLTTPDGKPGVFAEYFANTNARGKQGVRRIDSGLDYNWGAGSPDPTIPTNYFSARFVGKILVPESAGDVVLSTVSDDGVRMWIDEEPVIDHWKSDDAGIAKSDRILTAGKTYRFMVTYMDLMDKASFQVRMQPARGRATRAVWIPPGSWIDAWSGRRIVGPMTVTNTSPLNQIPLYVKAGSVLPLAPEMQSTSQRPWDEMTLDVYPADEKVGTVLYEDDTRSEAYKSDEFRKTSVSAWTDDTNGSVHVSIGAAEGIFPDALNEREWVLRIHRPERWPEDALPGIILLNGAPVTEAVRIPHHPDAMPFGDKIGAPDGDIFEIRLPRIAVGDSLHVEVPLLGAKRQPQREPGLPLLP